MTLLESMVNAASFTVCPTFSLFGVSSQGEYTLIASYKKPGVFGGSSYRQELEHYCTPLVEQFKQACIEYNHAGLEVRVDGKVVQFDRV